jgi:hypothetical protein
MNDAENFSRLSQAYAACAKIADANLAIISDVLKGTQGTG